MIALTLSKRALIGLAAITLASCGSTAAPASPPPSGSQAGKPAASQAAASVASTAAGQKVVLAVPATNITAYAQLLPVDKGMFAQHGLSATVQQMAPNTIPAALSSGDVQFTNATGAVGPAAVQGLPVRVIALFQRYEAYSLVASAAVKTPADLKGKRVAVPPIGGDNHEYVVAALKQGGLTEKDVQAFPMSASNQVAESLLAGNLDAGLLAPPLTQQLAQKGFHELTGPKLIELPSGGLGASQQLLQQQPKLVEASLEATIDGLLWMRDHPQDAVDYFASKFSLTPDVAKAALDEMMDTLGFTFTDRDLQPTIERTLAIAKSDKTVPVSAVYDLTAFNALVQAKHLS
ncbi:MAG TPA: ABC transporter substrate-binding protein [Chloroflexota bacterium]|nr:ABC transporter substrate-binding protein [Chloroflexota bacterium]